MAHVPAAVTRRYSESAVVCFCAQCPRDAFRFMSGPVSGFRGRRAAFRSSMDFDARMSVACTFHDSHQPSKFRSVRFDPGSEAVPTGKNRLNSHLSLQQTAALPGPAMSLAKRAVITQENFVARGYSSVRPRRFAFGSSDACLGPARSDIGGSIKCPDVGRDQQAGSVASH